MVLANKWPIIKVSILLFSSIIFSMQEISIRKSDLYTAIEAMYHVLKDNTAFRKYDSLMDLLARNNVTSKKEELPRNATLRSNRLKAEIIQALGKHYLVWCVIGLVI